ncbi:hypothetical protein LRS13_11490 [Svornostia abyssi]|uniref:Antitoxin FitA-like ribbon-helix-helix domain-containing protein n=1 Tax=Svornostia abyssi TaxID=2898438 RepID=A0ABY5PN64_9ACTN|nr:hypothetical protein LRS13_11490 [Parviterribacteraceae bacterium J379]
MGKMLQIKDIPDDIHRVLKSRASLAGVTLTEYARETLVAAARRPSREELADELAHVEPVASDETAAEARARVRAEGAA